MSSPLSEFDAEERLLRWEQQIGARATAALRQLLPRLPEPALSLNLADRFLAHATLPVQLRLRREPALAQALLLLLSVSQFLAESLLQSPELLLWLDEARRVDGVKSADQLASELAEWTAPVARSHRAMALTRFKRREYLRIVLRDLLGLATLAETTAELSHLADAMLHQTYVWAWNDLIARFGAPVCGGRIAEMTVIGLGKLGGEELNYSSDIDLLFIYSGAGETDGQPGDKPGAPGGDGLARSNAGGGATSNHEFFTRVAQEMTAYLTATTREGIAYRVDLRLRPGGGEGELALSLDQAVTYYSEQARGWEWQMLIRARHVAGSSEIAAAFLNRVSGFVYRSTETLEAVRSVLETRERISAQLENHRARGRRSPRLDVKLDAGGIRDIEFLIQGLQRLHGGRDPWLRTANTLVAMQRLQDKGWLGSSEAQALTEAHWLLRNLEHRLQLVLGQQTHTMPEPGPRLEALTRGLLLAQGGRGSAGWLGQFQAAMTEAADPGAQLMRETLARMSAVREIYARKMWPAPPETAPAAGPATEANARPSAPARPGEMALRQLAEMLGERHAQRHWKRIEAAMLADPVHGELLDTLSAPALARLADAMARSDYVVEWLLRRPAEVRLFAELEASPAGAYQRESRGRWIEDVMAAGGDFRGRLRLLRHKHQRRLLRLVLAELELLEGQVERPAAGRRAGRASDPTLREPGIGMAAPLSPRPIEVALRRISRLADLALECALRIAAAEMDPVHENRHGLAVLALGRLGLGELDLFSDVDLILLAPEPEQEAATRLATRFIEVVTAYTQEGTLLTLDTRLRTGGGEGELVQTPRGIEEYFRRSGGAWEAVTYLKARPAAGDRETAEALLERLRPRLVERCADRRRLRQELVAMRDRIEREARPGRSGVKTGRGGYYDIDFLLSSRLLAAPAIPIRGLGLSRLARRLGGLDPGFDLSTSGAGGPPLDPGLAAELAEAAATLRAADHALRIALGKAPAAVPEGGAGVEIARGFAAGLLERPIAGSLAETVAQTCTRVRELYDDWMGARWS